MSCFHVVDIRRNENRNRRVLWPRSSSLTSSGEDPKSSSEKDSVGALSEPEMGSPGPSFRALGSRKAEELRVFSYPELKTATRNFFRGNLLGEGGFGCVYKGVIKHKKTIEGEGKIEVAVKQLNRKGPQGHKEWLTEVHFLGLLEHPNLVKLVGYCAEDDNRGIQRLLVYEFMPNKSLEEHLFHRIHPVLPWELRVHIALGAARGLAYLHEGIEDLQVIFRDFKTSNVLLDSDFTPKLSDFGLAREGPGTRDSHVTTVVVGTMGYAAPEYLQTGHLTTKSDVWSFGIVLLELLTGRRALDKNKPKSEQRLIDWVKPYIKEGKKFSQLMDPRLEDQYSLRSAQKVASLASKCLQRYPRSRPKMSEVVEMLNYIVEPSSEASAQLSYPSIEQKSESLRANSSSPKVKSWSLKEAIALLVARKDDSHSFWNKMSRSRKATTW